MPAGLYDFVHLLYDIRHHKNLSLAFINFLDHETARAALHGCPSIRTSHRDWLHLRKSIGAMSMVWDQTCHILWHDLE